ncbi:MAG: type II toxin-antitoxin system VapC family toxin [Phycisphaerales bacterium]|nr:type II toxin-antitoxin system VapC family toxin [Phycisphaerales bacterium]
MAIVVDTSVVIAVTSNEPNKGRLIELTLGEEFIAPVTLPWEFGNAISAMFKQKRISLSQGLELIAQFRKISIRLANVDMENAIRLAASLNIYAYDAYVIQCARQENSRLLTLDGGLKEAAKKAGIEVMEVTSMTTYTDEQARQQLDAVLKTATRHGEVRIKAKDVQEYALRPVTSNQSPLDIPGVDIQLSAQEIVGFVREVRDR